MKRQYGMVALLLATVLLVFVASRPKLAAQPLQQPLRHDILQELPETLQNQMVESIQKDMTIRAQRYAQMGRPDIYADSMICSPVPRYSYYEGVLQPSIIYTFPIMEQGKIVQTYDVVVENQRFVGMMRNEFAVELWEFLKTNTEVAIVGVEGAYLGVSNRQVAIFTQSDDQPARKGQDAQAFLQQAQTLPDFGRIQPAGIKVLGPLVPAE